MVQRIFYLVLSNVCQVLIDKFADGPMVVNIIFSCLLGIAAIIQVIVPEDLRRQNAEHQNSEYLNLRRGSAMFY